MARRLSLAVERFPIAGAFTISRGSRTEIAVVVATLTDGDTVGRGECVPYPRYGESVESVSALIEGQAEAIAAGIGRDALMTRMEAGAGAQRPGLRAVRPRGEAPGPPAWAIAGLPAPQPVITAYTLSLGTPRGAWKRPPARRPTAFAQGQARRGRGSERIAAVRAGAPDSRLIVDANEAWRPETIEANLAACLKAGVALIEQPLPADADALLAEIAHPVPVCADESLHDRAGLDALAGRYDAINIKLDKTGGLTEAVLLAREAKGRGLAIMVGCMLGTSLGMAPAALLAEGADFVDLDGPLLLARDRDRRSATTAA